MSDDADWMAEALALAERGRGAVEPNPLVGAVVVRDGQRVGSGWHQRYGGPHAEVFALAEAGAASRGATLYVTLEPCCHHGKTPPCTDAIIAGGISRVVAAMRDPFPQVSGRGQAALASAGITCEFGVGEAAARRLNAPYLTLLTKGRPYVIAKWAMTLDGKLATRTGSSQWISGPESRRKVHELRGRVDAILVGGGTARVDNPRLTARPPGPRDAVRVVLSDSGELFADNELLRTARDLPVIVAGAHIPPARAKALRSAGCEVFSTANITSLLQEFGRRRWTNLLVEGGAGVFGSLFDAGLIDEVQAVIAPKLIGGSYAPSPIGGLGRDPMVLAVCLADWQWERVGDDLWCRGLIPPAAAG